MSNVSYYKTRNQFDTGKIKNDIYDGKLAEYGVYEIYKNRKDCIVNEPDVEVYSSNKKSFDADLLYKLNGDNDEYHLHVKAQHILQSQRFGKSWSFQKEDSLVSKPKDNELITFCSVLNNNTVEVYKAFKAKDLVEVYKDPVLDRLKGIKKVIYFKDLK